MGPTIRQTYSRRSCGWTRRIRIFPFGTIHSISPILDPLHFPKDLPRSFPATIACDNRLKSIVQQVNRNKKSLGLSFASPQGQSILHKLAQTSDILVENYLPNTLSKYNLDYATLSALNPSLIYASITGYGQTGPYSSRAGYDVMVEAEMGLMHITGERDGAPVKVGVAVTDLTTGLYTSNAIMAALIARSSSGGGGGGKQSNGKGQHIDIALSDCQVATLSNIASSVLVSGQKDSGRWGTSHPSIVPYRGFPTAAAAPPNSSGSEGGEAIMLGGGNDRLFTILCTRLGKPEWSTDPRFLTNDLRVQNRHILEPLIESITRSQPLSHWLDKLEGSGVPYAAINDVKTTLEHEHVLARGMVTEVEHPMCGKVRLVNTPVKYSGASPGVRSPPPVLGQHTREILSGVVGLGEGEIEGLIREGVVR